MPERQQQQHRHALLLILLFFFIIAGDAFFPFPVTLPSRRCCSSSSSSASPCSSRGSSVTIRPAYPKKFLLPSAAIQGNDNDGIDLPEEEGEDEEDIIMRFFKDIGDGDEDEEEAKPR